MNALTTAVTSVVLSLTALAQIPPGQQAREELNLGVKAYRNADYEEAVEHFHRAELLDPGLCTAKVYLATAYAQQYVPGVDAEDNAANGKKAIDSYKATLECDPHSVNSLKGIGFLNMQMKKFEEAKQAYREALKLDDKDPELYYSVGVIDWTEAYGNSMKAKTLMETRTGKASKKTDDDDDDETSDSETSNKDNEQTVKEPLSLDPGCPDLRRQNAAEVEDGIQMLTRAIELRKDYDDAMAYLNLLYRERAKIECGDQAAVAADLKKADEWTDLAMDARKRKAEAAAKCQAEKNVQPGCMISQGK